MITPIGCSLRRFANPSSPIRVAATRSSLRNLANKSRSHTIYTGTFCGGSVLEEPAQNNFELEYEYDPNRISHFGTGNGNSFRIHSSSLNLPGAGQKIQDLQYDYDDVGNPTDITSQLTTPGNNEIRAGAGNWHFDYDNADRLLFATACHSTQPQESTSYQQNFEYTKIHNIRDKKRRHKIYSNSETCDSGPFEEPEANNFDLDYEYDPQRPHRVTEVGGLNFQYDASGNLLQKGEDEFEWDDDNHLIYSRTNHKVWNYYDAAGLRVIKKSADFGTTLFISQYFDARLVENENSASKHFFAGGTRIASEIIEYNPEIEGDPSQATGSEGRAYFFVQDHLGSSGFLLSESAQVVEHLEYFADGDIWIDQNDEAPINGYKFTGKFFDPETGFYDHGQRFYDPKTSLWMSIDPLGTDTPGAMVGRPMVASFYGYANLNSLRFIDPDGRDNKEAQKKSSSLDKIGLNVAKWISIDNGLSKTYYDQEFIVNPGTIKSITKGNYTIGWMMGNPLDSWFIGYPGDYYLGSDLSTVATRYQYQTSLPEGTGNKASPMNAFRHTFWMSIITSNIGWDEAFMAGYTHESDPNIFHPSRNSQIDHRGEIYDDLDIADNAVDLLNNQIGRAIGMAYPNISNQSLALLVLYYYKTNGLWVASQITTGPNAGKYQINIMRITEEQYLEAKKNVGNLDENGNKK